MNSNCKICEKEIDIDNEYCEEHRIDGVMEKYVRVNSSEHIASFKYKRLTNTCKNCGFEIMLRVDFCPICQYDFDTKKTSLHHIIREIQFDFL